MVYVLLERAYDGEPAAHAAEAVPALLELSPVLASRAALVYDHVGDALARVRFALAQVLRVRVCVC
jgi:hypothetical protein